MKLNATRMMIGIAVVITAGLLVTEMYLTSSGDFKCTNTEAAILAQDAKVLDPNRYADKLKKDDNLEKYCAVRTKECGELVTPDTTRVLAICEPYR